MKRALKDDLKACSPLTDLFLLLLQYSLLSIHELHPRMPTEHSIIIWAKRGRPPRDLTPGIGPGPGTNNPANAGNAPIPQKKGGSRSTSIDNTASIGAEMSQRERISLRRTGMQSKGRR
jgi:hypothetical protein